MKRYILRGSAFTSREAAFEYLRQVFHFPPDMGHNLDALWELLHDKEGGEIEIDDARAIPRQMGEYGLKLLNVFGDLQREEGFSVHFYW